jgi:serine/threonine-protein kinase
MRAAIRTTRLWQRLRDRKLVQWALAYSAGAFALLQAIDIVAAKFGWPEAIERGLIVASCIGFFVALVLAWFHGERGAQRVSGMEAAILAVLLAIGGGALWRVASTRSAPPASAAASVAARQSAEAAGPRSDGGPAPARSIAVLPFDNLSEDKANRYFADGLQDLILTKLADIGELTVISRTSTAKYASRPDDLRTIAQKLGVAHIVEGSVQKAGNEVMINVQLIDARADRHLWAENYRRTLDNIFGVEGEVASTIAAALKAKLTPAQTQAVAEVPTRNAQAYDNFLRGLHLAGEVDRGDAAKRPAAIAAYEQAVAEDPRFALAWAALAQFRADASYSGLDRSIENLKALEQAAARSLELAPDLADAHLAAAAVHRHVHKDYGGMRDEAQRAIDLRPNFAEAYQVLGISEWHLGDYTAAREAITRAAALSPGDASIAFSAGVSSAGVRDYDAARRWFQRVLAIAPQSAGAYQWLAELELLQHGDVAAASKVLESTAPGTPQSFGIDRLRVRLLSYRRDFAGARALAAQLAERFPDRAVDTAMLRGESEWLAGDRAAAGRFYRAAIELLRQPNSDVGEAEHEALALAFARLGDSVRARAEYQSASAAFRDSTRRPSEDQPLRASAAEIQLALGDRPAAIDQLARALAQPGSGFYISAAQLRIDPAWDPIRDDPGFQALLAER